MSSVRPVPAVRPASRRRPGPLPGDLEATRLARVDPHTGCELAPAASDPDATILGSAVAGETPARPVTAEVIPPRDFRASREVTAAWDEPGPGARLGLFRRLRLRPGRFPLAVVLGAVAAVLVAGVVAAGLRAPGSGAAPPSVARDAARDPQAVPVGSGSGPVEADPVAGADPEPAGNPPPVEVDPAGAAAAAALADGRLEEARALYSRLAAAEPGNRAWSLALEILPGPGGER